MKSCELKVAGRDECAYILEVLESVVHWHSQQHLPQFHPRFEHHLRPLQHHPR